MPLFHRVALSGSILLTGCFAPGDSEVPQDTEATSTSGSASESGDPSGTPTESDPSDPSSDATDDGSTTTPGSGDSTTDATDSADSTTGTSECNDVSAPCPDEQYCVDNRYCDNPPAGMVAVPGGPFMMGCNEELDSECEDNEFPYHEVFLSAFAIDRTEVTVAAYADCVADGVCSSPHPMNPFGTECTDLPGDFPVTCVDWFQAREYCEWIGGQLPTEAQWEKAARGTDGRVYPWGNEVPTCTEVNMSGCEMPNGPIAVASKPAGASPYGALDMAGNVFEWVADWYSASYYVESPAMDPLGPDEGTEKYPRNAAFYYFGGAQRASFRGNTYDTPTPADGNMSVGFRCAFVP